MDNIKHKWNISICESCKVRSKSDEEFRQLITLTPSGLTVFVNTSGNRDVNKTDSFILHNVGNKVLKKLDFFGELCRRKTKCYLCNTLIQRVCNLVNEVTEIKENEMIAVCEHCKRSAITNKCKKCDNVIKNFLKSQINQYQHRQQALKVRLYEVRRILSLIVDKKSICDHKICQAYYDSNSELKILLELIKSPLPSKQPDIDEYLSLLETRKESVQENIENDLLLKCCLRNESKESLDYSTLESRSESFCICKYLRNRNVESMQSITFSPSTREPVSKVASPENYLSGEKSISVLKDANRKYSAEKTTAVKKNGEGREEKKPSQKKSSGKKKIDKDDDKENISVNKQKEKKTLEGKKTKPVMDEDFKMMMKLVKAKDKEKKRVEMTTRNDKLPPKIPKIDDLPEIKRVEKIIETVSKTSESFIECGQGEPSNPPELILGNRIVPFMEINNELSNNEPLIYKINHEFEPADNTSTNTVTSTNKLNTSMPLKSKSNFLADKLYPGVIRYELSNKKFIENGWTQLPSTKVVRRMNIYKTVPAYPQFDWFANHKRRNLFYSTGEKLSEADADGCGRWFYKNGPVALEYYASKGNNAGLKYVVYDVDDVTEGKKSKPRKILASFDHLGNGIVYDNNGNTRLKYNQSEGLVIDKKLGPPGRWKWHNLNDPPVLEHIFIDNVEKPDTCFKDVVKQHINDSDLTKRVVDEEIIAIEFENLVKEKAEKMLLNYSPFKIRMKAVKINEYFSVRIMSQANIQLLFRCNQVSLKVYVGMLLISNEIVDTSVSDVADVITPFDRPMSRSQSDSSI